MLYYFFVTPDPNNKKSKQEFSITISSFTKKGGQNKTTVLEGFKGAAECINAGFIIDSTNLSPKDKPHSRIVILIGLKEGYIKTVELISQNGKFKTSVFSKKVENKPILSITTIQKNFFNGKNICLALIEDSKVFVYNYLSRQVIIIYQPATLSHDFAVMLTMHVSRNFFATVLILLFSVPNQDKYSFGKLQSKAIKRQRNLRTE